MLSPGAFNALLKTLEEPPEHVKFFFATTEPNKIPITVLSRCQRYDFAGITPEQIVATLSEICALEHIEAEPEALRTLARRAGGSMRDAQSLLEQLLSSAGERLTVDTVHRLLGTASDERLLDLIDALANHQPADVLQLVERAAAEGVQPSDLLVGVLEFLRDVMVLSAGAEGALLTATPRQRPRLQEIVDRWPLDSVLAALQILDEARRKLRGSPNGRLVVEIGLMRVARLEDLCEISTLVERLAALEAGRPLPKAPPSEKKKLTRPEPVTSPPSRAPEPAPVASSPPVTTLAPAAATPDPPAAAPIPAPPPAAHHPEPSSPATATVHDSAALPPLDLETVREVWQDLLSQLGVGLGKGMSLLIPTAISGPNILVIRVGARYNWVVDECGTVEARSKIEQALEGLLKRPVTLRFERGAEDPATVAPPNAGQARSEELAGDPLVQKVIQLFEARPVRMEVEEDLSQASSS
jgi:DNA polymerase-3 subunit gamma/tau